MSGGHTGDELQLDNVFFWRDKVTTGISPLAPVTTYQSPLTDAWYTLDGRKVANGTLSDGQLPKGIYIHNGKKFVIK